MRPTDEFDPDFDGQPDVTLCLPTPGDLERNTAGPSSLAMSGVDLPLSRPFSPPTNGHTNGNGAVMNGSTVTNGASSTATMGNGVVANGNGKAPAGALGVRRVNLPGELMYEEGPALKREEFVRLIIQSLKDVGYV
jgi:hypothetical protein